ncbi:MAG: hypothetical protein HOC20_06170, partial [Chloroflexi bacterium]|nr:hypothetical protein [Chloroflexota bacterium]
MKKGTIIAGLSALLGLMLFVIFRYSPVAARQLTQDDPEKPQIAMVIDVSNSMSAYLFPSELPGDLKLIQDRIKEVEGSEDFIQLSAALKAIDEDPDVIQAIEAYQSAVAAAEVWITENGFGSQNELERQISSTLSDMGCNSGFADDLFDAENMAAVDILIS